MSPMQRLDGTIKSVEDWLTSHRLADTNCSSLMLLGTVVVLALVLLPFGAPFEVEEAYLAQAHKYLYPDAYGPYSSVIPLTNRKAVFDVPFGLLVQLLGFKTTIIIGRFALIAGYAFSLTRLARIVGAGRLGLMVTLFIFIVGANQALFAKEHILRGVEPKAYAYIFVLFAICDVIGGNKGWRPSLLLAAAFYLHFLVGGWWALFLTLVILATDRSMPEATRFALRVGVLVMPLIAYIAVERSLDPSSGGPLDESDDWIYSIYGNPFHVAPFSEPIYLKLFVRGYFWVIPIIFVCFCAGASSAEPARRRLSVLIAFVMIWMVIAFPLDYLLNKEGALGKFFMFRANSLALLLFLVLISGIIRDALWQNSLTRWLFAGLAAYAIAALCLWMAVLNLHWFRLDRENSMKVAGSLAYISGNSARDSVVLLSDSFDGFLKERQVAQPALVNFEYIPDRPSQLREWYRRLVFREEVFAGICHRNLSYPVRFAVLWRESNLAGMAAPRHPTKRYRNLSPQRAVAAPIDAAPCWRKVYEDQSTAVYEPVPVR